jgi:hypothetical protein
MKRLVPTLVVAGVLSTPLPALALRTQTAYDLTSPDGVIDASDVGIAMFELDADTGPACRYYMQWIGPTSDQQWISLDCWVDEIKVHGGQNCFANSLEVVPSVLVEAPRLACTGFSSTAQIAPVLALVLGESSTGSLLGVIQYSPQSSLFEALEADPYP